VSRGNDTQGAAIPACPDRGVAADTRAAGARAQTARQPAAPEVTTRQASVDTAIDALSARAVGENFPVAMRVLPREHRRHLMAVYRFARLVDDIGDEAHPVWSEHAAAAAALRADPTTDRLRALDAVEEDLGRAFSAAATWPASASSVPASARSASSMPASSAGGSAAAPRLAVVRELARTAAECAIPAEPFRMLIDANRQDQTVSRYATFDDLLGYCELSANPVGRIVLHVFSAATPERERLSDLVCTALQLAEHWQDVAEDFARDRVYLPQEDIKAFGCTERDLASAAHPTSATSHRTPACVRELMRFETERAGRLLNEGAALVGTLHGWARLAVAGYVAGGRATLAAIAAAGAAGDGRSTPKSVGFDVSGVTPRPGRARTVAGLIRAYLTGR
jgi:squalene synthase HpnC